MEKGAIDLLQKFKSQFGIDPVMINAPGRINIIGEHTDYNDGFVLPAAINKSVKLAIQKSKSTTCHLIALDLGEDFQFSIDEKLIPVKQQWVNYFLGVLAEFKDRGVALSGFNVMFTSDLPIGAGLSSSAAIECGVGFGLCEIFGIKIPKIELALMGQHAEHKFAGVKCGIMDQFASMMGRDGHVMKLDCRSLEYEYVPVDFDDYQIVLLDTQVKHNLADSEYNIRRTQCESALTQLQSRNPTSKSLRDVAMKQLNEVRGELETKIYNRGKYVIEENARVTEVCELLKKKNITGAGELMFKTHEGLKDLFEVSCKELDILVDAVSQYNSVAGARMMGGGFGGCTINLIRKSEVNTVIEGVREKYLEKAGIKLKDYQVSISDGVKVIY